MTRRKVARNAPPGADTFEVSIFGPGKGEALAVHLGGGDWITVDSCVEQKTKIHPVLRYFEDIGVDAAQQVRLVVGTHAHDDHVAGISSLFEASSSAKFVSSPALTSEEFLASVEADEDIESQMRKTVREEYRSLVSQVLGRGLDASGRGSWLHAIEQRVLWERPSTATLAPARVVALSPSDVAIARSRSYLASGLAKAGDRRRLAAADPNDFSVALWVEFGRESALLGADLETGPAGCGWQAVIASHRPSASASLFKVPHHGSGEADLPAVWSQLLSASPISVLAPFRNGSVQLPTDDDVSRLVANSSAVYAAASSRWPTPSRAVQRARSTLSGVAQNVREPHGLVGQVRARRSGGDADWSMELFSPALRLE
ncbi:ComEC/Rec2 family competence protein [Nocardioides xinjiangensis]|uniref:hypothetical protein n=1 Tax=Nocardioides xinjiangensis TaxID=2817376 RepID=UPI001B310901|nr:hypothetical protein [Nocardioides sp. SYSU D00514]